MKTLATLDPVPGRGRKNDLRLESRRSKSYLHSPSPYEGEEVRG